MWGTAGDMGVKIPAQETPKVEEDKAGIGVLREEPKADEILGAE